MKFDGLDKYYLKTTQRGKVEFFRRCDQQYCSWASVKEKFNDLYKAEIEAAEDDKGELFTTWTSSMPHYDRVSRSVKPDFEEEIEGIKTYYYQSSYEEDSTWNLNTPEDIKRLYDSILKRRDEIVTTTYHSMDKMTGGGFQRGWIYAFETLTGKGKSTFSLNFASRAVSGWRLKDDLNVQNFPKLKVVYFDSENGHENSFENMLLQTYKTDSIKEAFLHEMKQHRYKDVFSFKEFATKEYDIDYFRSYIAALTFVPDVLIFDLMDDLLSKFSNRETADWMRLQHVTEELANLAKELNVVIIFSTQGNRNDSQDNGTVKRNLGFGSTGGGISKLKKVAGSFIIHNDFSEEGIEDETFAKNHRVIEARKKRGFDNEFSDIRVYFEYEHINRRMYEISETELHLAITNTEIKNTSTHPEKNKGVSSGFKTK